MKNDDFALTCIGGIALIVFAIAASSVANGWALVTLWDWFIVPTFGVGHLSIAVAIGISLTVGLVVHEGSPKNDTEKGWTAIAALVIAKCILQPLFVVFMGYIVHLFM